MMALGRWYFTPAVWVAAACIFYGGGTSVLCYDAYSTFKPFGNDCKPVDSSEPKKTQDVVIHPSTPNKSGLVSPTAEDAAGFGEVALVRRLFQRPTTREAFETLKAQLTPVLLERLKKLSAMNPTVDVGLEMADSVYILDLLGSSSAYHEKFVMGGRKARKGAMLLAEGAPLLAEAQELVESAVAEMSKELVY